jgi:hypothetical protein
MPAPSTDHAGWRSRGYLPHLDAADVVQHIVLRLADSLPARLRDEFALKSPADRAEASTPPSTTDMADMISPSLQ